ncbi:MAG: retroviral-like aspartic protease family protein [Candidatus Edwardsbacteria bacterium]
MGKVTEKIEITNYKDQIKAEIGIIRTEEVRRKELNGLVDSGATMLTLPEEVVEDLGLTLGKEVEVTYADGRKEKRPTAYGIKVEILGREAETFAVVGRKNTQVLIGQIVLEALDLVIDPKKGKLGPRPESPDIPLIEIY